MFVHGCDMWYFSVTILSAANRHCLGMNRNDFKLFILPNMNNKSIYIYFLSVRQLSYVAFHTKMNEIFGK